MTAFIRLLSTMARCGLLIIMSQVIVQEVRGVAPYRDMCDDVEGPSQRGKHRCGLTEFDVEDSRMIESKRFLTDRRDGIIKYSVKNAFSFLTKPSRAIPTKDAGMFDLSSMLESFEE